MSDPFATRVHKHLHNSWGDQACQINPSDWPDVFARYMKSAPATPGEGMTSNGNHGRGSLRGLFNEAVSTFVAAFGAAEPPADPVDCVWRAFPKLDLEHCTQLAQLLLQERANA